jgi:hypothetical protein
MLPNQGAVFYKEPRPQGYRASSLKLRRSNRNLIRREHAAILLIIRCDFIDVAGKPLCHVFCLRRTLPLSASEAA